MAESFFASLECELIDRRSWQTKTGGTAGVVHVDRGLVQPAPPAHALNYRSPINFVLQRANLAAQRGQHGLPTVGACVVGATPPVDYPAPEHCEITENLSP